MEIITGTFWHISLQFPFLCIKRHLYIYVTYFERGLVSDALAGHSLSFCLLCPSSMFLPLTPSPLPPNPNHWEWWRGVKGWRVGNFLPGLSQILLPVSSPAKLCAFLLQLSEGLNKGNMQLCSNILIIYCSEAHITVHHHLERLIRTEGEFSPTLLSVILFYLIFPSSPHVISHGLDMMGRKNAEEEKSDSSSIFVGMRAFWMWSSLLNVIIW